MNRDPILDRAFSQRMAVTRIAERAGISTAAVSQWMRVPRRHVEAVAEVTGISPDKLRPDLFGAVQAQGGEPVEASV